MRALAFVMLACATAVADPRADAQFESGQKAFQAGDFTRAIELFRGAYELVHDPVYLFNIAQAYRKQLDCEQAAEFYNRYLADAKDADKKQRDKIAGWLRELAPCVEQRAQEHAEAKRNADALAAARADAERKQREAAIPRYLEVDRGGTERLAGIVLGAAGLGLMGLGTFESFRGRTLANQVAVCSTSCDWAAFQAKAAAGHTANVVAAIGWASGGALAIGGTVLYYLGAHRYERVQINATATGASVSAHFTF